MNELKFHIATTSGMLVPQIQTPLLEISLRLLDGPTAPAAYHIS